MEIHSELIGGFAVINVTGRIEATTVQEFEQELGKVIMKGNRQILLDFSGVPYINSSGLRVILATAKKLKNTGDSFALCSLTPEVNKIIDFTGFSKIIKIYNGVNEALTEQR
jgi:anti-sigma B factor antagonist